jgi:hypothetical protein
MKKNERFEMIRRIKLNLSEVKPNKMQEGDMENPCWEGYEPYGTKVGDDGREVPNCVPIQAKKVKEGFPIPSPSGDEDENAYMSRCMSEIGGEYDQEQALAICYSKWRGE